MNGILGEIRMFAADFEPKGWAFCKGRKLSIREYPDLYSVIGKSYGGDGKTYFMLPDFMSKAAVGAGEAPGLSKYDLGQQTGVENITLTPGQMPAHIHLFTFQPGGPGSTKATLHGARQNGDSVDPGGRLPAQDTNTGAACYASVGDVGDGLTNLNEASIQITGVTGPRLDTLTLSAFGNGRSHNNVQPSLALNYIICIRGSLPPR